MLGSNLRNCLAFNQPFRHELSVPGPFTYRSFSRIASGMFQVFWSFFLGLCFGLALMKTLAKRVPSPSFSSISLVTFLILKVIPCSDKEWNPNPPSLCCLAMLSPDTSDCFCNPLVIGPTKTLYSFFELHVSISRECNPLGDKPGCAQAV